MAKLTNDEVTRWKIDPLYWAQKFLSAPGKPYIPSKQQRDGWEAYRRLICAKYKRLQGVPMTEEEKQDARRIGVSIQSGHGTGKDAFAAAVGLHFLMCMYEPKVLCTAPAGPQLEIVLWPEFAKWISRSELLQAMFEKDSEKIYKKARGSEQSFIKKRTIQPNASPDAQGVTLAGAHSTSVMFILDEASGIPPAVFKPIEGGMTDPIGIVIMIYNPTERHGFAIESQTKNRRDWICLHWDAEDLRAEKLANPQAFPWFDEEAQLRLERKYGKDSNFYRVRVKGLPPNESEDTLIPWYDVMEATRREIITLPSDPLVIGVDVAGEGDDKTIIMPGIGPLTLNVGTVGNPKAGHEYQNKNTTEVSDLVAGRINESLLSMLEGAQYAVGVDTIGIGRGVYDQLVHVQLLRHVHAIDVSERPIDESKFHRLRDEIWWNVREAFMVRRTPSIPDDDELIAQLTTIKWKEEKGKIKVEGKPELKKRGIPSPNKADAFCIKEWLLRKAVSQIPKGHRQRTHNRRPVAWTVV